MLSLITAGVLQDIGLNWTSLALTIVAICAGVVAWGTWASSSD